MFRAGDEIGDLLLLDDLPADEILDVGMIQSEADHLRRPPRGSARFARPGRAVADLEEAHQAARSAATRERLALAAQVREIGTCTRSVLEDPRLADPQVHD